MEVSNESSVPNNTILDVSTIAVVARRLNYITTHDDATWILTSAIIVFTMQSGFGLLESGSVSEKNEANIMVKNVVDVIFGGVTYWMFGYGLSFGDVAPYSNPFCGWGSFFVTASEEDTGWVYAHFFFQASFATTATTIVSGSMAERTKLEAYIVFSMLNTFIFSMPSHWMWATNGWLRNLGVVDIAGAGPVHIVGGVSGLLSTLMLKPRHDRFKSNDIPPMGSPTNAILGMFMLWWGFLGFACGCTFGISGLKWKLAARSAVAAVCTSIAGGIVALTLSYIVKKRKFDIGYMINGILGSLVGITSICVLAQPWEALIIGSVGALVTTGTVTLVNKLKIDDPVGCFGIHACSGMWSLLAAGLFVKRDSLAGAIQLENVGDGLVWSGNFKQLGIQYIAIVSIVAWTIISGSIFLKAIDLTIGLRVPLAEEILGADLVEHSVAGIIYDKRKRRIIHVPGIDDGMLDLHKDIIQRLLRSSLVQDKNEFHPHTLGYHIESSHLDLKELFSKIVNSSNQDEKPANPSYLPLAYVDEESGCSPCLPCQPRGERSRNYQCLSRLFSFVCNRLSKAGKHMIQDTHNENVGFKSSNKSLDKSDEIRQKISELANENTSMVRKGTPENNIVCKDSGFSSSFDSIAESSISTYI